MCQKSVKFYISSEIISLPTNVPVSALRLIWNNFLFCADDLQNPLQIHSFYCACIEEKTQETAGDRKTIPSSTAFHFDEQLK
jgi:hypothetical protein